MNELFAAGVAEWGDERLVEFWSRRHAETVSFLSRPAGPDVLPYAPFLDSGYEHKKALGNLLSDAWSRCKGLPANVLVPFNPLAMSELRPGKRALWDAAAGIPACSARMKKPVNPNDVRVIRNTNTDWLNVITPALSRAGKVSIDSEWRRPSGPFILDITALEDRDQFMEAAHVLAHLRGDNKPLDRRIHPWESRTAFHLQAAVAELAFARMFGLPVDVSVRDKGVGASRSDFPYGIELKSTSRMSSPLLRVPWATNEAPYPDKTMCIVSSAVLVESAPVGWKTGSMASTTRDRWACLPSMAVVVGWELVDVVMHAQTGVYDGRGEETPPINYVMQPYDLRSPGDLWAYLALAHANGMPIDMDGRMYYDDFVRSDRYRELAGRTPALPCRECMRTGLGVLKPSKPYDPGAPDKEWDRYATERKKLFVLLENAQVEYEALTYGKSEARVREERKRKLAASNAWRKSVKDASRVDTIEFRKSRGKAMSTRDRKFLARMQQGENERDQTGKDTGD